MTYQAMKKIVVPVMLLLLFTIKANAQVTTSFNINKTFHIASDGHWDYIAVGPDNNRLYVSHETQVNILNETTGDSVGVVKNTTGVHGIAFDAALNKGFTSNGKINTITVFELTTDSTLAQIATGNNPDAIMYEPFSKKIIVCNGHGNSLSVIDPVNDSVIIIIPLEGNPETAVSNDKGKLYINIENKNEIALVNTTNFTIEAYWPLSPGEAPAGLAIDKITGRLFSGCSDTKLLMIMDASDGKIISRLPIGSRCDGVCFDPGTKNIFASNGDGTLTIAHENTASDFTVIQTLVTKKGARTSAVDPITHLVYLPTADFDPSPVPVNTRPKIIPGSFEVLVIGN
jgi:YVTN family beta-propeller protein